MKGKTILVGAVTITLAILLANVLTPHVNKLMSRKPAEAA